MLKTIRWAYGVTTCPQRRDDLLPKTLASLRLAGFDRPRLFVDGDVYDADWLAHKPEDCTFHYPPLRAYGTWILGLAELYLRDPRCQRYALFQDDLVCCRNLRAYLDRCAYPKDGYWNLYTFPCNQRLCPGKPGGGERTGWYLSDQMGKGAVALVFDRPTVQALLANPRHAKHMVQRVPDETWGHRKIDGAISEALNPAHSTTAAGMIREWVHSPSLVQHVGSVSTIQLDNLKGEHPHPQATSFRGETFDALDLLKENEHAGRSS